MAGRIRSIKPEVLDDREVVGLSDEAWRLWVSTWLLADDHGNCRADERYLASLVWQDSTRSPRVAASLGELRQANRLILYCNKGEPYLHIRNWDKHQRISNAGRPRVPGPDAVESTPCAEFRGDSPQAAANVGESPRFAALTSDLRPPTSDLRPPTAFDTNAHAPAIPAAARPAWTADALRGAWAVHYKADPATDWPTLEKLAMVIAKTAAMRNAEPDAFAAQVFEAIDAVVADWNRKPGFNAAVKPRLVADNFGHVIAWLDGKRPAPVQPSASQVEGSIAEQVAKAKRDAAAAQAADCERATQPSATAAPPPADLTHLVAGWRGKKAP